MKISSSQNVAKYTESCTVPFHVLTTVAVSIFYNLALLLLGCRFENIGSVVLKLFNTLQDVIQGSEWEMRMLTTLVCIKCVHSKKKMYANCMCMKFGFKINSWTGDKSSNITLLFLHLAFWKRLVRFVSSITHYSWF